MITCKFQEKTRERPFLGAWAEKLNERSQQTSPSSRCTRSFIDSAPPTRLDETRLTRYETYDDDDKATNLRTNLNDNGAELVTVVER